MPDADGAELNKTVLHDWHVAAGAKMVDFGGWHMPVQYPSGIIREHLATRRHAGLFDVSHMGRFRVRGAGAEDFLLAALTNNARALDPGHAQYTFIANQAGGAVDDAYLYRLGAADFLLVVNAANRAKDWQWLEDLKDGDIELVDESDARAMVSLQGPHASQLLEDVIETGALPENKRNRLGTVTFDGHDVIIARTGYTGESVCFELFPGREVTVGLWQALIDRGARPVGLGARDSLRLEAGLPLYGHELGEDPEGREIPIFANGLARFAVRPPGGRDYVGRAELEKQRDEFIRIERGELATPVEDRVLPRVIVPIAVFGGRKPLRAGHKVRLDGRPAGYVTSGTSVPFSHFYGQGITAAPSDDHGMRPIGLALVRSDIRYRADRPVVLEIEDDRGKTMAAELVERNLWPVAPYGRPYTGFRAPPAQARAAASGLADRARRLARESRANTGWRRTECINLIPSEQPTSAFVDALSAADPAARYNEHNRMKALGPDAPEVRYYKGTAFIMDKEEELKAALRAFFGCANAEPRVISGQMANDTVYDAVKQFKHRHRAGEAPRLIGRILVHDLNKGGHLSAQPQGALKNYVAMDERTGRPAVEHFPLQADNPHRIDVEAAKELIVRTRPELLVFGRSVIIHTEPIAEIARFIHREFGRDNPARPIIHYDAAHVLGLLGPHFQEPFADGADLVTGSTHKTFFGPQRGVVLGNFEPGSAFEPLWTTIESRAFPGHVSNHHLGTMLGLLGATYEMLEFRDDYPKQVIANAKAFARALADAGVVLEGDAACGFTETHQVLIRTARGRGEHIASLLEANNVITNPQAYADDASFAAASGVRTGTQEMTRYGMKEADFRELAGLIAEIVRDGDARPAGHWKDAVKNLRGRFTDMQYCFPA